MRKLLVVTAFLGFASVASAQAPNVTSYTQEVFAPGVSTVTGSPMWTNVYTASAAVCNQTAPTVPPSVVNPTRVFFDDAANPGRVCIVTLVSGLLAALPNQSGYLTTMLQTDNLGQSSARSDPSNPFGRQGPPSKLTGVKIQ